MSSWFSTGAGWSFAENQGKCKGNPPRPSHTDVKKKGARQRPPPPPSAAGPPHRRTRLAAHTIRVRPDRFFRALKKAPPRQKKTPKIFGCENLTKIFCDLFRKKTHNFFLTKTRCGFFSKRYLAIVLHNLLVRRIRRPLPLVRPDPWKPVVLITGYLKFGRARFQYPKN